MKQKKLLCAFLAATVALGLTACNLGQSGKTQEASYPITVGTANLAQQPDFVVSLSPMLTRTMEDLGLSGRLTGVSSFDQELTADWEDSPAFCGTAQLPDLDAIRGAKPALGLTQTPVAEHDLVKIQQMGAEVLVLSPATSIEGMKENYRQLFLALWGETEGARRSERFNQYLDRKIQNIQTALAQSETETGRTALYLRELPSTGATGGTLEGELLELLGFENAAGSDSGWKISEGLTPDVVFYSNTLSADGVKTAYPNAQLIEVDPLLFEQQSPSLLFQLFRLGHEVYPDSFVITPEEDPEVF